MEDKKDKLLIVLREGNIVAIDCTKDIDITIVDWDNGNYADDVIYEYELDNVVTQATIDNYINVTTDALDDRANEIDSK